MIENNALNPGNSHAFDHLMAQTLALDLEVTKSGQKLRRIGAIYQGQKFEWEGARAADQALTDLDAFGCRARYVLGHNIFNHDLPFLKAMVPGLRLLDLPVIDTLYLSPLAFPRNPYHRLVKDYKLVRSSVSDPVEDVRLALSVFSDQWQSFGQQGDQCPEILSFYAYCFQAGRFNGFGGNGLATVLHLIGPGGIEEDYPARERFIQLTEGLVCRQGVDRAYAVIDQAKTAAPVAAYSLAWLKVAGSNSVLPPWVRHQFPQVVPFLSALRDIPCGDPSCGYCRQAHDPDAQLKRFFGFSQFRAAPQTVDGKSLQREVVLKGMRQEPLMAIMPTGGGKSLCYQLPALVRHMRRGLLTVVISPLQALMKDQVDNLVKNTGTPFAAAIYGLLTPPERGEVIERVRMGDVAVLYISPEQLRSRSVRQVLTQREIGSWVFDEAHCLSKWGHDFRPDYLYAARFIRELCREQHLDLPPIACFTATAKPDVIEEIGAYFRSELEQSLQLFAGGVERDNLHFDILPVGAAEKPEQTFAIVQHHLEQYRPASVIVYAARRKTTEEVRDYLVKKGLIAEAFHAGLEAHEKRRIIEAFVAGETPVICATNAFGMGIDKSNIRLVLHYDLPGSLENYLQEAGRAGRDMAPANCILLYDPHDAETQFALGARSQIDKDEIQRILKCLRRSNRNRDNEIVITTQELLRDDELAGLFEKGDKSNETKVRTAVSWLERADFLERNQNLTQVFQGKPRVKSIAAAEPILQRLKLSQTTQQLWRGILLVLFNKSSDAGLSADDIAECLFHSADQLKELERQSGLTAAQLVIYAMHEMALAGLLDKGMLLSAHLHCKGKKSASRQLAVVGALEERMLKLLQEEAPDAAIGEWLDLDINRLNQRLHNDGEDSNPVTLRKLVFGLTQDGRGLAASHGSIDIQHAGGSFYCVALQRSWSALLETAALRRSVAGLIVRVLAEKASRALTAEQKTATSEVLIEFGTNELEAAIRLDLFLHPKIQKPLAAIDRGLMFLHDHKIIALEHGLAVFRQAMTIRLNPHDRRRQYTIGDYKPLSAHYRERRFQVHVIVEYATLALEKVARAIGLVLDYFSMPRESFVHKYFNGRREILERATSDASYRQIVESLNNPVQIGVVGSPVQSNHLVLAGPGAGKTRLVVYRCAYLLRVERIPSRRILVMCFNHAAAVALRKRLMELAGPDARGVTVATYHGAAMRLAGLSVREMMEAHGETDSFDFNRLIRDAVGLLKGEKEIPGLDPDEMRDQLLQGFSHILVDEYQDIDQDQYDLISAIAGRSLAEGEGRLAILAVGDDDQNIYSFRGANVEFIKRFEEDYQCGSIYMVENYRSSDHIIQAANRLMEKNRDRMKKAHPIRVNRQRKAEPRGGAWETKDPISRGRVQRLKVKDPGRQTATVYEEMKRLRSLNPESDWSRFAVLGRTRATLDGVRAFLEKEGVPVRIGLQTGLPLHRVREVRRFLANLKALEKEIRRASELYPCLPEGQADGVGNHWTRMLKEILASYVEETADAQLPVFLCVDWLYEAIFEQRREKSIGQGVFLSTVHGAKGLEFEHVFILDGDWRWPADPKKQEEERRLLYVGMTRAKETLGLMEMETQGNPFIPDLDGEFILKRDITCCHEVCDEGMCRKYSLVGLSDLFLGYAGYFAQDHPIHRHLAALNAGDLLQLVENDSTIDLKTGDGHCVARLSAKGFERLSGKLKEIVEARIIGMIQWSADSSQKEYRQNLKTTSWEVPLIELTIGGSPSHSGLCP